LDPLVYGHDSPLKLSARETASPMLVGFTFGGPDGKDWEGKARVN